MAQKKAVILRIDPKLWKDLNIWAQDELRSLNGQVEYVLREAVIKRKGKLKPTSDGSTK
ncbi:MAG: Arc family DNA binding domain-containing protein [Ignavibacteriales bacterium]|nr:Arc family DNA binding domain-containing protein [Ignavibacteriales bacterium]